MFGILGTTDKLALGQPNVEMILLCTGLNFDVKTKIIPMSSNRTTVLKFCLLCEIVFLLKLLQKVKKYTALSTSNPKDCLVIMTEENQIYNSVLLVFFAEPWIGYISMLKLSF